MAVGAFLEPLVVVTLLFGGAWFNRNKDYNFREGRASWTPINADIKKDDELGKRSPSQDSFLSAEERWSLSRSSTPPLHEIPTFRRRKVQLFGYSKIVNSPNTLVFKDRFLSRVLQKYPFLAEAWYWALIYWVSRTAHIWPFCRWASIMQMTMILNILFNFVGLSARPRRYCRYARRRHRERCSSTCPASHSSGAAASHLLGGTDTEMVSPASDIDALDQPNIFVHSYPWDNLLSRRALLLDDDTQASCRDRSSSSR